jgi:hypothetical protein
MNFKQKIIEFFHLKGKKNKKKKFLFLLFYLVLIGLFRLIISTFFNIKIARGSQWYSFRPDVLIVMIFFPIYLSFFLAMVLDIVFNFLKIKKVKFKKILIFFLVLQLLHLIVPFLELIGQNLNFNLNFKPYLSSGLLEEEPLNPFSTAKNLLDYFIILSPFILFFSHHTLITLGISVSWLLAAFCYVYYFLKIKIPGWKVVISLFIIFQVIYLPIYRYFFVFDQVFAFLFLNKKTLFFLRVLLGPITFYDLGYGSYFLLFGLIGLLYSYKKLEK